MTPTGAVSAGVIRAGGRHTLSVLAWLSPARGLLPPPRRGDMRRQTRLHLAGGVGLSGLKLSQGLVHLLHPAAELGAEYGLAAADQVFEAR